MTDVAPATDRLAELVAAVRDDQLGLPTPCAGATLGDLLDHADGLSLAFTASAKHVPTGQRRTAGRRIETRAGLADPSARACGRPGA